MFNIHDSEYLNLLRDVLEYGEERTDRTGTGTIGLFSALMDFPLNETFPLLTTKKVHWKSVVHELLWIMRGDTNVKYLRDNGVTIWDEWADENGDLGPVYGAQWRHWPRASEDGLDEVDQLERLIDGLRNDPHSRRHVISAWNVAELDQMALPPCHALVQFYVSQTDNSLHAQLYQRSADLFLGVPFNIASYALLTCVLSDTLGLARGSFKWIGGDCHIYSNHVDAVHEQLQRWRNPPPSPRLKKIERDDPLAVTFDDIVLEDYNPLPPIKAPVSV